MPKQFSISLDDFNYAAEQMQLPLKNRFGDLDWERRLAAQNNELYRNAIRVSGANLLDAPALTNYALRRAMTCVFASIYHAMGRQLPRMTLGQWREIQFAFAKPRVAEPYTSLLVRVEELIKSINPWLAHTWVQAMERDVRRATHATDEQMAFVSALVLLLVANLLEEPYFRLLPDKPADKPGTTPKPDEKKIQQQVTIGDSGLTSVASEVTFDDIGGCRQSKDELRKLVQRMTNPQVVNRWGGRPPKAVLLQGPHGTGKTMLVSAFAQALGWPFFVARLSDIVSVWVNHSPALLRSMIDGLCRNGGVLALNEADALLVRRGTTNSHHEDEKLVNEWNICMDLIKPEHRAIIFLTTNFTDKLDEAAIRDGRVDRILDVRMPDAADRREVFSAHIVRIERKAGRRVFSPGLDLNELSRRTDGMNPAAIATILSRSVDLKIDEELGGRRSDFVTIDDLFTAIAVRRSERDERKNQPIGFLR